MHFTTMADISDLYNENLIRWPVHLNNFLLIISAVSVGDDGKRPDGMTLDPWSHGRPIIGDVTIIDTIAPSHINESSLLQFNEGTLVAFWER